MEITEVRIKLMEDSEDRLRAFCSITFDHCFVVRDLKIIEGVNGPFVAMPSRKMSARCGKCGNKNHLRSHYCNQCGARLRGPQDVRDPEGGANKLYADIAHPINQPCRDLIQNSVIKEYVIELERAKQPGYKSRYDDEYLDTSIAATAVAIPAPTTSEPHAPAETAQVARPHFLDGPATGSVTADAKPPQVPSLTGRTDKSQKVDRKSFGDGVFE